MQIQSSNPSLFESSDIFAARPSDSPEWVEPTTEDSAISEPTRFYTRFEDYMVMNADPQTVAEYLDVHQVWFTRCAHPMKVEPLSQYGYALVIGKFGAFGYEVEPKVGLELEPQDQGVYRIHSIPVPNYTPPGYDVDFRAVMELVEIPEGTRVQWQLDLNVYLQFPRFIQALPQSLIQSTGDRILYRVVRQVSRCLTRKVLLDFHTTHNLPLPAKKR